MDNNRALVGFCLGAAAGMVAGLMLKSPKGQEVIENLRHTADEKAKGVRESIDNLSHTVTTAATRGVKTVRHEAENLVAAVDAGKQAYRSAKEMTP